jgi:uncharacterized membrane protein YhhN
MAIWLPIPFLLVTVTALIVVDERVRPGAGRNLRWVGVWKPLSTLLVILVAALAFAVPGTHDVTYALLILAGLLLSLVGDVLLIFPTSRAFMAGLIAFLCAHLAYIGAFIHLQTSRELGAKLPAELIAALVLAGVAATVYRTLQPKLGQMRLPVILYMAVITVMVHRALAVAFVYPGQPALPVLVVGGALLFYLSDAILAIDRFKFDGAMPHGRLWSLSAYYAGQLLLALSVTYATHTNV